jgi:glycosyltransferase involved in cell wall biosynthesis
MKKINIIQFLPYYPPHKWWLETHALEWWNWWVKKWFWQVFNIVTDFDQENIFKNSEKIVFEWIEIWYIKDWVENLVCPSFEIINNFPVYKIWSKQFKLILKYLKKKNISFVITRTRFFLTSLIWWLFARKNKIKWIHIEHWSDYVKLNSKFKNVIAKFYDKIIWKWIFKKADKLVWVSNACKKFIQNKFVDRKVEVIYRWVDLPIIDKKNNLKNLFDWKIIIWFIWRLFKWKNVDSLINVFYDLEKDLQNKIQIVIIWDGEDLENLKKLDKENKIYFTWWKNFKEAIELQSQFDIHFHTSSKWWWLATTLLQAMALWKFIISTPYEWADEVIKNCANWILLEDDSADELKKWLINWIELFENKKDEFALANKKIFWEKFSWEKNILKYYKILNEK